MSVTAALHLGKRIPLQYEVLIRFPIECCMRPLRPIGLASILILLVSPTNTALADAAPPQPPSGASIEAGDPQTRCNPGPSFWGNRCNDGQAKAQSDAGVGASQTIR